MTRNSDDKFKTKVKSKEDGDDYLGKRKIGRLKNNRQELKDDYFFCLHF